MGVWLITVLIAGAAALGIMLPLVPPQITERTSQSSLQQDAGAQARIAFELLVKEFLKRNANFVGVLGALDMKAAGTSSSSLTNGVFPPDWSVLVGPGGELKYCTPVPPRAWPAMIKNGFNLESLKCANP